MQILTLDVETTTSNSGNAFDRSNKLVLAGFKWLGEGCVCTKDLSLVQEAVDASKLIVGFAFKFDLHWLRRCGVDISRISVWDCQLAHFMLGAQQQTYPSLNEVCELYGFPLKLDVVKTEYWEKGIDTDEVPNEVLTEYLEGDLTLTERVYLRQKALFLKHPKLYKLFKIHCADLLCLQEMEFNGMMFATKEALEYAHELQGKIDIIVRTFHSLVGQECASISSGKHLSAILYGGIISEEFRIAVGHYKSGLRKGEVKYGKEIIEHKFERLVTPKSKTETANSVKRASEEQEWSVGEDVLLSLRGSKQAKKIIDCVLEYRRLEKLRGTYLQGYSDLITKMNWEPDMIHGNLNQCTVVTGRLSSSAPNLQNADKETKKFLVSRYDSQL